MPKPSRFWSTAALAMATLLEEVNASITLLKSLVSLPKPKYDEVSAKERSRLSHLIGAQHNSAMSLAQVADTISTAGFTDFDKNLLLEAIANSTMKAGEGLDYAACKTKSQDWEDAIPYSLTKVLGIAARAGGHNNVLASG